MDDRSYELYDLCDEWAKDEPNTQRIVELELELVSSQAA